MIVLGSNENVIVLPLDEIITPFDCANVATNADMLSDTTLPDGVLICVIVFECPIAFVLTANVIVFPLALIGAIPAPAANVIFVSVFEDVTTPESVLICFIALVAPAADATLTLNVIVLPLTLVVRPVPPAKVTDAEVLEEVTVPSSPTKLFINGFAP